MPLGGRKHWSRANVASNTYQRNVHKIHKGEERTIGDGDPRSKRMKKLHGAKVGHKSAQPSFAQLHDQISHEQPSRIKQPRAVKEKRGNMNRSFPLNNSCHCGRHADRLLRWAVPF